jgi:hypothetical protein
MCIRGICRVDLLIAHRKQARTPLESVLPNVANEINGQIYADGPDLSVSG